MKRLLAAVAGAVFAASVAIAPALAANNVRTSAQPLAGNVANGALTFDLLSNEDVMGVNITGLAATGATVTIEGSTDGRKNTDPNKTWFATVAIPFTCPAPATFSTISTDQAFKLDVSGMTNIRFRVSSTGTAGPMLIGVNAIPSSTLGSCGGSGGGGSGGSVNIHDSAGNNLTSTGGALNVAGTFSATLGGFTPSSSGARMTPLTVQLTDSSQTLPTGAVTVVSNTGTTYPMYCNVNGVAATTSDQLIPPSSWFAFTIPATITTLHCIATGGTTVADGVGGAGLPTGSGGGGGSSGSNASVGSTGSAVPGSATYAGMNVSGNLTGLTGTANGLKVDPSAVTAPVNNAQVNGVTILTGAGATGTGAQRVGVAQDTTTIAGASPTTTGVYVTGPAAAALATSANQTNGSQKSQIVDGSGNVIGSTSNALNVDCVAGCSGGGGGGSGGSLVQATTGASIATSSSGSAIVITHQTGQYTYVTSWNPTSAAATSVTLEYGTGSNCGTGTVVMDAIDISTSNPGMARNFSGTGAFTVPIGSDVCVVNSAAVQIRGSVAYTQSTQALASFGGGGASPFVPSTSYINAPSVSTSPANSALPTGAVAVVYNYGSSAAGVSLSNSSTPAGTAATADAIVQAGSCQNLSTSGFTNINYFALSSTTSLQIVGGSGNQIGCGGGGGGSGGTADSTLTATGTLSAADVGMSSATWTNGQSVLTGTPTAGSTEQFAGFSGVQTGTLICFGTFTATLEFDIMLDTASPAHYVRQTITELQGGANPNTASTFTGPIVGKVNLTNALGAQIRATAYTSGSPTCTLRITTNIAQLHISGTSFTGATGSAVPGSAIYGGMNVGGNLTGLTGTANGLKVDDAAARANVSPTDCSGTVATGGTAQNALGAQSTLHGLTIANIDAVTNSGEVMWISFTGTAVAGAAGSYPLSAPTATTYVGLSSYTTPPGFGLNHALSVIATTTGHKFSCTWW